MLTTVLPEHLPDVRRVFVGGYSRRGLLSQVRATCTSPRVVLAVVSLMVNRGTDKQMGWECTLYLQWDCLGVKVGTLS